MKKLSYQKNLISLLSVFLIFIGLFKGIGSYATTQSGLFEVASKYRKTGLVTIQFTKTVKSNLLGKESKFKGTIYLGANKFRMNVEEPEKNQIIFDGSTIWNVQFPPKELPGPVQIAKAKLDKNSKKQILISTLISKDGLQRNFKLNKEEKQDFTTKYFLTPLNPELNLKSLEVNVKESKFISLTYKDDVGNLTHLDFEKTEFSSKTNLKIFKYKPNKEDQVTNL